MPLHIALYHILHIYCHTLHIHVYIVTNYPIHIHYVECSLPLSLLSLRLVQYRHYCYDVKQSELYTLWRSECIIIMHIVWQMDPDHMNGKRQPPLPLATRSPCQHHGIAMGILKSPCARGLTNKMMQCDLQPIVSTPRKLLMPHPLRVEVNCVAGMPGMPHVT